jgi:hypothetical protein
MKTKQILSLITILFFSIFLMACGGGGEDKLNTLEDARKVAVGNWIADGGFGWCIWEINEDGTYTFASAIPSDGKWGEKSNGTWDVENKFDEFGDKSFFINFSNGFAIKLKEPKVGVMRGISSDFGSRVSKRNHNDPWNNK